jgi:hypothetical protein
LAARPSKKPPKIDNLSEGMAALDMSKNFTVEEVEEILAENKKVLKKIMMSYSESGSQVTYQRIEDTEKKITACQHALRKLDPFTYGKTRRTCQSGAGPFSL